MQLRRPAQAYLVGAWPLGAGMYRTNHPGGLENGLVAPVGPGRVVDSRRTPQCSPTNVLARSTVILGGRVVYVDGHVKRNSTVPPSCPGPTCHPNNHSMPASTFRPGGTGSTGPLFVVSRMACCRVGRYSRANPSTTPCPSLHSGVPIGLSPLDYVFILRSQSVLT